MTDTPESPTPSDAAAPGEPKLTETPAVDTPPTGPATAEIPVTRAPAGDGPPSDTPPVEPAEGEAPETVPAAAEIKELPKRNPYYWGTGRRKTAIARVRVKPGDGKFLINKKEVDAFFRLDKDRRAVRTPLNVTDTRKAVDVFVNVHGGGISGQSGAVVLGLARALVKANPDYESPLRAKNLLTRDPRKVERKKYGQRGARRRFQFSKR